MSAEKFQPKGTNMEKPAEVQRARFEGDTEALRAMGRKGAAKRFENAEGNRLEAESSLEKHAAEEAFRREQSGENVIPPNLD